jgi:hypothetical protein
MSDTETPLPLFSGLSLPAPGTRTPRRLAPSTSTPLDPAALDWLAQRAGAKRLRKLAQAALSDPASAWRELDLAAARVEAAGIAIRRSPRRDYGRLMRQMEELLRSGVAKTPTEAARIVMEDNTNNTTSYRFTTLMGYWRASRHGE